MKNKAKKNLNFTFLLPVSSGPRFFKRIKSLQEAGLSNSKIFSFDRDHFDGKGNVEYESLGNISHGRYFARMLPFFRALFKIRKNLGQSSCIYAFGLDCALLGVISEKFLRKKNKPLVVYECADIRSILLGNELKNKVFRLIERWVMRNSFLVITTSPAFTEEYFIKIQKQNPDKFFLLENKIKEPVPMPLEQDEWQGDRPIVIGYFGALRCQRSFDILVELARYYPSKFYVYIRGYNLCIKDFEETIENEENIEYGNTYVNPDDLSEMYGRVDLVWNAYTGSYEDYGDWKWAMANRFYESCYYGKPMIVNNGTQDAKRVEDLQIGTVIDMNNFPSTINALQNIKPSDLLQWENNIRELPKRTYVYTNEHKKLIDLIQNLK